VTTTYECCRRFKRRAARTPANNRQAPIVWNVGDFGTAMALSPSTRRPTPATNTAPVVARPLDMGPIVEHPRFGTEQVRQSRRLVRLRCRWVVAFGDGAP
jgi:hypothetical protein